MRVNSTVALTLILLTLMVGAGVASAAWGYALGREALKGVTQPDVRPNAAGAQGASTLQPHEFEIIPEAQILEDVKTQMDGNASSAAPVSPTMPDPSVAAQATAVPAEP